jgi:hypothetical protein
MLWHYRNRASLRTFTGQFEGDFTMAAYVTYGRPQRHPRGSGALIGLGCVALLGLVACSKLGLGSDGDEMSWARAALERNSHLEVVAADPQTSTFTVRVKDTGELRMIRADQVVGGPPSGGNAAQGATSGGPGAGTASGPTSPATTSPAAPAEATLRATTTAANSSINGAATAAEAATPSVGAPGVATPGAAASTGPRENQAGSQDGAAGAISKAPHKGFQSEPAPAAETPNPNSDVAAVTPGGRTLESGPGYAIKVASKSTPAPARVERSTTNAAVERRHEPIICQGERLLQIDSRNLEFDGDAVSAEDGCEIHITNSHIVAKGIGIAARHANVHIDNSQIESDAASIDSSEGGQVYARSSRFKGLSRRLDNSSFHDLGGNIWN